jgi:hypothetical protein
MREIETQLTTSEDSFETLQLCSATSEEIKKSSSAPISPIFCIPGEAEKLPSTPTFELGISELPEITPLSLSPQNLSVSGLPKGGSHAGSFLPSTYPLSPALSIVTAQQTRSSSGETQSDQNDRFHCDFPKCNKSFNKNFTLTRHKKTHSKGKLRCEVPGCGRRFTERQDLLRHMKARNIKAHKRSNYVPSLNTQQPKRKSTQNSQKGVNQINKKHKSPDLSANLSMDILPPVSPFFIPEKINIPPSTPTFELGISELPKITPHSLSPQNPSISWLPEGGSHAGNFLPSTHPLSPALSIVTAQQTRKSSRKTQSDQNVRFFCDFPKCKKSFKKNFTLTRHKKSHSKGKFCCEVPGCGRRFTERQTLLRHMQAQNIEAHKRSNYVPPLTSTRVDLVENTPQPITDIFQPFSPLFIPGEIENLPSTPSISLDIPELPEIFQPSVIPQNSTVIPAEQGIREINSADTGINSHSSSRPVHDLDKESMMNYLLEIKQAPKPISHDGRLYCDFPKCKKSFKKNFILTRHQKIHGEKNLCCEFPGCGKRFHERPALQRHMKTCKHSIENLPSIPSISLEAPEFPEILQPSLIPQNPSVTLTAQPVTEVKIAVTDKNPQEIKSAEAPSCQAGTIQKDKNSKEKASMTLAEQTSSSYSRDALILPIIAAVKSAISLMFVLPAASPEQRKFQMTSGIAGIRNVLYDTLPVLFSNKKQLESKVSSITKTIQSFLSMILATPATPEQRELQIILLMDIIQKILSVIPPIPPIDLTSTPTPVSDNPTPNKNLDSKYTPTIFSGSAQHQQSKSSNSLQTHVPKQGTDTSSPPSRNPCALFGSDRPPSSGKQAEASSDMSALNNMAQ